MNASPATSSDEPLEGYYRHQVRTVQGLASGRGFEEGWAAPVGVFDAAQGFGEDAWVDHLPVTTIATRLSGGPVRWCYGRHAGRSSNDGPIALQPRDTPNHFVAQGPIRFAQIYLTDHLIDRVADAIRPGAGASGVLRDDLIFLPDRRLDALILGYVDATIAGGSALELEASAILLIGRLLRDHHGFDPPKAARGGLAPWQLKRACEAMDTHLDQELGLDMLATIAGCSATHFSRAFKQSTGLPPFQWLLERRIERAKEMLTATDVSLAEVALAVGFAAQPQFTTAFKRATGRPPGAWRRERLA